METRASPSLHGELQRSKSMTKRILFLVSADMNKKDGMLVHETEPAKKIDWAEIAIGFAGGLAGWICSAPLVIACYYLLSNFENGMVAGFIRNAICFLVAYSFCQFGFYLARGRYRKKKESK